MFGIQINNLPDYALGRNYVVYRYFDGEAWFYGAYTESEKAFRVAEEVGGCVAENLCPFSFPF